MQFKKIFLSVLLIISAGSFCLLFIALCLSVVYVFGQDSGPGSFLLWMRNPQVLATLITLSCLLISSNVRLGGQELLKKFSDKIEKIF